MASIFLSYAREDRRLVEKLARVLEEAGNSVWWDRHIDSGREFAAEIESQLHKADLVLVAWSDAAAKSPWVRDEAAIGRDRGRLLPVLLAGSQPPIGFRQLQSLDLSGWKGRQNDHRTKALVEAAEKVISGRAPDAFQPKRRFAWPTGRSSWAIAVALALVIAAGLGLYLLRTSRVAAEPASVAVLPFKNMSVGDPYFAEGVAEEISNQLAREPQFKVTGRTSSALFKDAADARDVGRRLHVAYVLEGSVRSAGNQVRVAVSLVDTRRGNRLWSQDFRGKLDDIFAIQDSIGHQVAASVKRQLVIPTAHGTPTTTGEVYRLYVTARSLMRQREPSKIDASIDLLKRAVKLDSNYGPAWARLGFALGLHETYGEDPQPLSTDEQRIDYIRRGVALAPQSADGHAILGITLIADREMDPVRIREGRQELEKAVRLNPSDAESWYWLHYLRLSSLDFEGALNALRTMAKLDPFFVHGRRFVNLAWEMGYRNEAVGLLNNWMKNHPDAFWRTVAQAEIPRRRNDLSGAYQQLKRAREIASPDVRSIAENLAGALLLNLQLLNEAERFVPPPIVKIWRGKIPVPGNLAGAFTREDALDFWNLMSEETHRFPRLVVKLGLGPELVRRYDAIFSSPADMATRFSKPAFVEMAPLIAIGLQQSGRAQEGARLLLLGGQMCDSGTRRPHVPITFQVSCSRLWSVLGRKELAIRTLEQAVQEGWRPSEGEYPNVTDEPAYAGLRNEARMRRIDAMVGADFARERRELLAGGL